MKWVEYHEVSVQILAETKNTRLFLSALVLVNRVTWYLLLMEGDRYPMELVELERGLHGLEPLAVANFPTKKYSDAFFSFAEDTQCTICLAEYREEDTLRILPLCGHYFHATCIDIWFQQHSTCPVCRISLRETADKKCFLQPLFSSAVRSQYTMDTLNVNSNQCSSSGQRLSSRSHDNQRTNPTTASASNA
ncbi:hypothetical protein KY290_026775 [Solanum tuberosum]|uniref:RING-type domain-containing protein n=1 Tax=Solanum tuberosum TaxID=4113 RepID=A0ABQ7V0K6_SOLTU|nr:hypothetical protein KY289_024871 [Solanum tuberosum]KAH0756505.1 hypothetical protein KY290_026775 [Solanum tuberosum]